MYVVIIMKLSVIFYRYWECELERAKNGHKPHLWYALLQCLWQVLLCQGVLFGTEVRQRINSFLRVHNINDEVNIMSSVHV